MRFVWGSGPSMAKGGDLSYKMKSLGWRIKWLIFRYCDQGHKFMSETLASKMNGRGKTSALGLHGSSFMSVLKGKQVYSVMETSLEVVLFSRVSISINNKQPKESKPSGLSGTRKQVMHTVGLKSWLEHPTCESSSPPPLGELELLSYAEHCASWAWMGMESVYSAENGIWSP